MFSCIIRRCLNIERIVLSKSHRYSTQIGENRSDKGLVLGLYEQENDTEEPRLSQSAIHFDAKTDGKLLNLVKEYNLKGKLGSVKVFTNIDHEIGSVAIAGLGLEGIGYNELETIDEGMENVRIAAGIGAKTLAKEGCLQIFVDPMDYPEQAAEGSGLSTWRYQANKTKKNRQPIPKLDLYDAIDVDAWTRGLFKADAQNLARSLSDGPGNQITPTSFAQAAVDALCPCGVSIEVRNKDWAEAKNMSCFLSVARSSCEPPIFLEISYCGDDKAGRPIMLAGTGMTFNSGGLCIKNPENMSQFRASMAGAASVVATIRAAAALSLPVNLVGLIPLCENMPSGMAFKPGDVITAMNGKTVAIHDTNNAGQLMLADAFIYGQTTFKPKLVVDVATLSEGIVHALGGASSGVFSNSDFLWSQMLKAGSICGDRVWRMPLWQYYTHKVTEYSNVDISNAGRGKGSACLGAAFLKEFIPCADWVHMDITGVGMVKQGAGIPYLENDRMTGRPTRTLIQFLQQLACSDLQKHDLIETKTGQK
ncbi:cytosol aminopeptidase-like [Anopheles ziemanni]|uniref:cytosol aminopeptidase-like n=1 Tax=Anopheles coustani TaxID=139045 RepID=UPI00265A5D95|nr:cytosol aminopeptidase-like [Anopheles coustani]XP_058167031.1 cytosol aminopeptidase-like [Anopheles ziemanni]